MGTWKALAETVKQLKRERGETVCTADNWRGWSNGVWRLREGKNSKEKNYNKGGGKNIGRS